MLTRTLKSNPTKDTFKNVNARQVDPPGRPVFSHERFSPDDQ
jgi:hypothetical protein